jgi:hypothetical protein
MRHMHANSLLAWRDLDVGERCKAILEVYRLSSVPLCDREIAERLGFTDMNAVRPRITELIKKHHKLMECGAVVDSVTGKTVRTVGLIAPRQTTLAEAI